MQGCHVYYGNTVQSGEHVTPGLSSFLEKRAPAQPAPRVQTHSFPRRLRGGRERRERTTLAVGFFVAQPENREGFEETLGSWRINQQNVWSTTGESRCCPAQWRRKLVCVGSSCSPGHQSTLPVNCLRHTHFKFCITIGIFSCLRFFFFLTIKVSLLYIDLMFITLWYTFLSVVL